VRHLAEQDEMIDGVPCTSRAGLFKMPLRVTFLGTERMAWFYEDGHLKQALLSCKFTIQGHNFKKGDVICLGADGKLDLKAKKLGEKSRGPVKPPWWRKSKSQT